MAGQSSWARVGVVTRPPVDWVEERPPGDWVEERPPGDWVEEDS